MRSENRAYLAAAVDGQSDAALARELLASVACKVSLVLHDPVTAEADVAAVIDCGDVDLLIT
jgi:hypothetical protein